MTPKAFFDFERDWKSLSNVGEDSALSKYEIVHSEVCGSGYINGGITVALWADGTKSPNRQLHYLRGGSDTPAVTSLQCKAGTQAKYFNISTEDVNLSNGNVNSDNEGDYWGSGVECESGPTLEGYDKSDTPPTLILNKTYESNNTVEGNTTDDANTAGGEVYLIVEESSNYPSFLYSVWTAQSSDGVSIDLTREFHIAATMRLAEAVVTGIVHGEINGRYCFELVRMYSEGGDQRDADETRAEPFGEHPTNDTVKIEEIETIECGVEIDRKAAVFCASLILLTAIGTAWSLCLRSSIGMDIYDRDELIRAVSMSGVAGGRAGSSSIRIFVRKEDTGNLSVAITDTDDARGGCARVFRLGGTVVEDPSPAPSAAAATVEQYNHGYGGAAVPVGPRTVWLEGVRTGRGRALPGRNGNFRYPNSVALSATASPIPSNACSSVATPAHSSSSLAHAPRDGLGFAPIEGRGLVPTGGHGLTGRRGPSVYFDEGYSPDDSADEAKDGMRAGGSHDIEASGTSSVLVAPPRSGTTVKARPLAAHPTLIEGSSWVDRDATNGVLRFSSGSTTPESSPDTPSQPTFLARHQQMFGPPQLGSLTQESERELVRPTSYYNREVRAQTNEVLPIQRDRPVIKSTW